MQKGENDAEKLIRKVTLKMIEKENGFFFFFTKKMRFQRHYTPYSAIFDSKNLKVYIYKGEIRKKKLEKKIVKA